MDLKGWARVGQLRESGWTLTWMHNFLDQLQFLTLLLVLLCHYNPVYINGVFNTRN